mmetsp:Transcript_49330/g.142969  ORF Transcript_49330/g.142969 Transcript_49330/m.142969 type:complete len:222 (+) Transcript_49330:374-1039(+)
MAFVSASCLAYSATAASVLAPAPAAFSCSSSLQSRERSRRTADISVCSCMFRSLITRLSSFRSCTSCSAAGSAAPPPSSAESVRALGTSGGALATGRELIWAMRCWSSMMDTSSTCKVIPEACAWLRSWEAKTAERFAVFSSSSLTQAMTCAWYASRRPRTSAQLKIAPPSERRSVSKSFFCPSMSESAPSRFPLQKVANLDICALCTSLRSISPRLGRPG